MASGQITLTLTDGDGQMRQFGVPGSDDVSAAYFWTKPLECGSPDVDKWLEAFVSEIVGTATGLSLSYKPLNRMADDADQPGGSVDWTSIGAVPADRPLFLDESAVRVARYVALRWDDSQLNAWKLFGFAVWGEFEGDEDALL